MAIKKINKPILATFWALIGVFGVILGVFFVPAIGELISGPLLFLSPFIIFSLLGVLLVFLTLKGKIERKLKKFLILTGASAAGFFVSILLHNLLYALAIITNHVVVLRYLFEFLHVAFFIIATLICPLGYLIGAVGSATLFIKEKKRK